VIVNMIAAGLLTGLLLVLLVLRICGSFTASLRCIGDKKTAALQPRFV
jgi:hypothetical protein